MQEELANRVGDLLIDAGKKIKKGNCALTQDEAMHILSIVTHEELSREQACDYMNMNSNKFADNITLGRIPKGRKKYGFKELRWYRDELDKVIDKLRNRK